MYLHHIYQKLSISFSFLLLAGSLQSLSLSAQVNPTALSYLRPVNNQSPRECLRSFLSNMNVYHKANKNKDYNQMKVSMQRALQSLDLSQIPKLLREEQGEEAAIYLKETIDRIFIPNYEEIPDIEFDSNKRGVWHLANTSITIARVTSSKDIESYLFSNNTIQHIKTFYNKVNHLPYVQGSGLGSGYEKEWWSLNLPSWLQKPFLTLNWFQWAGIFIAIVFGLALKTIVRFFIHFGLHKIEKTQKLSPSFIQFTQDIIRPLTLLLSVAFWFLCLFILQIKGIGLAILHTILEIKFSICLIWISYQGVGYLSDHVRRIAFRTESKLDDQLAPLFERSLKIITLIAGILLSIQNLGVNVASLLAGLGLGGLAVALAARDTVANLFGSLMIIFDRPFQIGDWVKVDDVEGNIEDIGFRSTRIRTFYNSIITIPNSVIASTQIDNMGAREYRRIQTNLNICYETSPQKIENFIDAIKKVIEKHPKTHKKKYYVYFQNYAESSLEILLYFYLKVNDWDTELKERQTIFLEIYNIAKNLNIEFAFPTQTLHIGSETKLPS